MPTEPKKSRALTYIITSLALIVFAIIFTDILDNVKNASSDTADIRTRANTPNLVKVEGIISKVNEADQSVVVDNLHFVGGRQNLGKWTVTVPPRVNLFGVAEGTRVTITVDPPTMIATSRTLTATEISVSK